MFTLCFSFTACLKSFVTGPGRGEGEGTGFVCSLNAKKCFCLPQRWAPWSPAGCDRLFGNVNARSRSTSNQHSNSIRSGGLDFAVVPHPSQAQKYMSIHSQMCTCVLSRRRFWLKNRWGITISIKLSTFQESSSVLQHQDHRGRHSVGACVRSLIWTLLWWWNECRCPTLKQGIKVLLLYKESSKNNPQAKIQTILLCTTRFASTALTRDLWQLLLSARVFVRAMCRINRYHLLYRTFELVYLKANA